jgi:hypothetical protein
MEQACVNVVKGQKGQSFNWNTIVSLQQSTTETNMIQLV